MNIDIKSVSGETLLSIPVNNGAKGYYSLMEHDYIVLPFTLREPIDFGIGTYADLRGLFDEALGGKLAKVYYVTELQNPAYDTSTGGYEYQLRMDAYYWLWNNFIFKYTPESAGSEASWSLTAALDVQMGVFLRNLKALGFTYSGQDFQISIDSTVENKAVAMTYDNTSLLDALFSMGGEDAWDCDVWITDNVIHFGHCELGDEVKVEIGVEASSMSRSESKGTFATRVYAFGSTRNIPENYRPSEADMTVNGVVQKRLMLPEGTPYVDAYPGMAQNEVVETVVVFDDIYPRRTGTLSGVKGVERSIEDEDGNEAGTFTAYQYTDTGLEFDEDYILEGEELRIVFQSGKLNGLDFGVTFNPEGAYPAEQLWEIVANEDYGRLLPDDVLKPEDGDEYILYGFDIQLVSDHYVPFAEKELLERTEEYVKKSMVDDGTYTVTLRQSWVKEDLLARTFDVGQKISLVNPGYFPQGSRSSRVTGWEMCLDIPYDNPVYTIGESTQYSRLGELEDKVDSLTYQGQTYTGGGGGVYVIRVNDSTPASDSNVFSALRTIRQFLRKDKEDSTSFLLRMLGGAHFFQFTQGMLGGAGGAFYKNESGRTYVEADGAYLRDELVVPQITFNCIDVISGDKANTFAFGTIKSVDTENRVAELDLLEGQYGTLHVNDICRGVFHNLDGGNMEDDAEDGNGFYSYAGFSTSYFTPVEITENAPGTMKFRYALQAGTSVHPMKGMNFFAYGNFTDTSRQAMTYETRYYTRRLKDVETWVIDPTRNISMQDGLLEGLSIGGMTMHGYGTFQENCYFTGVNIQFTPETEEAFKGEDAYNVSLSSYERVVKMDDDGNIISLLENLNVTTGDSNVTTGDGNVITTQKRIQTHIQAFKGTQELVYSTTVEEGTYVVSLSPQGCTASVDAGIVSIDDITATENCFVDIQVNCEGNTLFDKRFSVSIIRDGNDVYTVDLDNEMASVACDTEGNVVAGLPITTGYAFYRGTKALPISAITVDAPDGVAHSVDMESQTITVESIPQETEEGFNINVTITADDDGVKVTRGTKMTVLKMKGGENATLYQLSPSVDVVKIDKTGIYSEPYVSCGVNLIDGKGVERLETLPANISMAVRKDGLQETGYSINDDVPTENLGKSIEFRLYQEGVLIDTEAVPVVSDGTDGFTSILADLDNEMASVACDMDGNVTAGLPIESTVTMYYGVEKIALNSLTVEEPAGVEATADKDTGKITITSIADYTPDVVSIPVTCSGTFGGQAYERTAYIKVNKVKPGADGENAVIYSLVVEPSAVKVDKNGELSVSSVKCSVMKTDGESSSIISSLPSGYTLNGYVDGEQHNNYTGARASINVDGGMQSVGFKILKGSTVMDEETVPVMRDGTDALGAVVLDLDNEMASVACDTEGNVTSGLPITINFSMYYNTEEMPITAITSAAVSGVSVSDDPSGGTSTITSIAASVADSFEVSYTVKGTYDGTVYERKASFRVLKVKPGADGKNAVLYQLLPSINVIKVGKDGSYLNTTVNCILTKNDGGTVTSVSSLPSGYRMTYQRDSGAEPTYTIASNLSVTSASSSVVFRLYNSSNVLADMETIPVIKDGADGEDGKDGSDGADGSPGLSGCCIRESEWVTGREYRNDTALEDADVRFLDVALVQNDSLTTGWEAYICKKTHTSSSSLTYKNTTYWEETSQNVASIFLTFLLAKNAKITFLSSNELVINDSSGNPTTVLSGTLSGDKTRIAVGSTSLDSAPFRVNENGTLYATDAHITGEVTATSGSFTGKVTATSGSFTGAVTATSGSFSGAITATSGTMDNVTVSSIKSKNGNFSIDSSGNATVKDVTATGGTFTQVYIEGSLVTHKDGSLLFTIAKTGDTPAIDVYGISVGASTSALVRIDGTYEKLDGYNGIMKYQDGGVVTGADNGALVSIAGIMFNLLGFETVSGFSAWLNSIKG